MKALKKESPVRFMERVVEKMKLTDGASTENGDYCVKCALFTESYTATIYSGGYSNCVNCNGHNVEITMLTRSERIKLACGVYWQPLVDTLPSGRVRMIGFLKPLHPVLAELGITAEQLAVEVAQAS